MNRHRPRRSVAIVTRAPRARPTRAATRHVDRVSGVDRRPVPIRAEDEAALAFLSELLLDDGAWTLAEVRRLVFLRDGVPRG